MAATSARGGNLRTALVSACGLLGISGAAARATEVSTAVLGYTEPDRVTALEAIANLEHAFANGRSARLRLVYDALTGASANGAVPAAAAQTFTRPSGEGAYTAAPGTTPLDDTFRDTRIALSGGGTTPLGRLASLAAGLYVSTEHDYTSLGANGTLTRDFNKRNTTLALRAAYFDDTISPEGGRPVPFAPMAPAGAAQPRLAGDGSKRTLDLGVGVTQVIDERTVAYAGYTFSDVDGYQTDPYKVVSRVDGITGDPVAQLFENRPDARTKHVFYSRLVRAIGRDNLQLSYRYMDDDWGIGSHTVEARWRWNLSGGKYLQPHLRWYTQGAADFYRRYLVDGEATPAHVSADYRLGDLQTWTFGLTHGRPVGGDRELTVRAEYYTQTGESHPADAVGALRGYDLFPTVDAFIVQVGFNFRL